MIATETSMPVKLLPQQYAFLRCRKREKMYDGAFGSGKTRILCYCAVHKAMRKGNLVGLFRKTLAALKSTTLRTLLEPDGTLPPVLAPNTYTHNKTDHFITLHEGGQIYYGGLDDPLRIASLNLGSAFVDEAREMDKDEYIMLLGRIRNDIDPYRQVGLATNPDVPSHFLHDIFYKRKNRNRAIFKSRSIDNYFLPKDYLEMLAGFTGTYRDRFVLGKWVGFDGLVYDNWSRTTHLVQRNESWKWLLISIDEGYENPCSAGLHGIDADGRMHRIKTFYKRHVLQDEFVDMLRTYGTEYTDSRGNPLERRFVADPSAAGLIASLEAMSLIVEKADNAVMPGVQEMRNRLAVQGDGLPRYTVERHGEGNDKFVEEIEAYHYDKAERPAKNFDHSQDEARYACMYMRTHVTPSIQVLAESDREPIETDEERREAIMEYEEAWR